jgi:hypothetical protein
VIERDGMADRKSKTQKRAKRLKEKDARRRAKNTAPAICMLCRIRPDDPRHVEMHASNLIKHGDYVRSIYRGKGLGEPLCQDCGVNTLGDETYWLFGSVWIEAKGDSFLCVGCIEKRLGRELRPNDFDCISKDAVAVNYDPWFPRSERLKARMGFPNDCEKCTAFPKIIKTKKPDGNVGLSIRWK